MRPLLVTLIVSAGVGGVVACGSATDGDLFDTRSAGDTQSAGTSSAPPTGGGSDAGGGAVNTVGGATNAGGSAGNGGAVAGSGPEDAGNAGQGGVAGASDGGRGGQGGVGDGGHAGLGGSGGSGAGGALGGAAGSGGAGGSGGTASAGNGGTAGSSAGAGGSVPCPPYAPRIAIPPDTARAVPGIQAFAPLCIPGAVCDWDRRTLCLCRKVDEHTCVPVDPECGASQDPAEPPGSGAVPPQSLPPLHCECPANGRWMCSSG